MKKSVRPGLVVGMLCAAMLLAVSLLFLSREELPGWDAPSGLSASQQRKVKKELTQITQAYRERYIAVEKREGEDPGMPLLAQTEIDGMEAALLAAGYPTVDTDAIYPAYLGNAESLSDFWVEVSAGKDAAQSIIQVEQNGGFRHMYLLREKGKCCCLITHIAWDKENAAYVRSCELLPLYEMELADWGIFYYRMYPANDPHYIDYNQLRLAPVDRELYDLNREYIIPVGYQLVNLFLCDWQEGDWGDISMNDLFEYFYEKDTGERFEREQVSGNGASSCAILPAQLFEDTVLPYFQISLEEFRELCRYDEAREGYPWRPMNGDDLTTWHYPACEPMVIDQTQNSDGTITLTVQIYCPDLKTNRLFAHEVTIRPLTEGNAQYVGNRITYVSDRGLPPGMARFDLDQ